MNLQNNALNNFINTITDEHGDTFFYSDMTKFFVKLSDTENHLNNESIDFFADANLLSEFDKIYYLQVLNLFLNQLNRAKININSINNNIDILINHSNELKQVYIKSLQQKTIE